MPVDIILYAIVAAGLVVWLRNTLGTIDEDEPKKPNPVTMQEKEDEKSKDGMTSTHKDRVIAESIENKSADMGLQIISKADRNFELSSFITGAQDAFVMIVESFAKGEKETLEKFLAPTVYKSFESAINDRNDRGEKVETEIHAIRKSEVIEAKMDGSLAFITLRIKAEETCVIRDKYDEIISGNPDRITEMVDVWVFGRDTKSSNPVWFLYETRDDEEEDHKTPMPEAKHED